MDTHPNGGNGNGGNGNGGNGGNGKDCHCKRSNCQVCVAADAAIRQARMPPLQVPMHPNGCPAGWVQTNQPLAITTQGVVVVAGAVSPTIEVKPRRKSQAFELFYYGPQDTWRLVKVDNDGTSYLGDDFGIKMERWDIYAHVRRFIDWGEATPDVPWKIQLANIGVVDLAFDDANIEAATVRS